VTRRAVIALGIGLILTEPAVAQECDVQQLGQAACDTLQQYGAYNPNVQNLGRMVEGFMKKYHPQEYGEYQDCIAQGHGSSACTETTQRHAEQRNSATQMGHVHRLANCRTKEECEAAEAQLRRDEQNMEYYNQKLGAMTADQNRRNQMQQEHYNRLWSDERSHNKMAGWQYHEEAMQALQNGDYDEAARLENQSRANYAAAREK
jgi:hypothetical protein